MPKSALTIAGSDPSGGAGIQADLRTFNSLGVGGLSVVTLLTAQNANAVTEVQCVDAQFVSKQIDSLLDTDTPDAIKTGALGNEEIIKVVANKVNSLSCPLVVDTIFYSSNRVELLSEQSAPELLEALISRCYLCTPNLEEASILSGQTVADIDSMKKAARIISDKGAQNVLITGGHLAHSATDLLYHNNQWQTVDAPKIASSNTHGTGCTLSAAITASLASGEQLLDAVKQAKELIIQLLLA